MNFDEFIRSKNGEFCWGLTLDVDFLTTDERLIYAMALYRAIEWGNTH